MKIKELDLKQDSDEWHIWRANGIGASEMSVIMGSLPFQYESVLDLWKKKARLIESEFIQNEAMTLGKNLEPKARDVYSKIKGELFVPKCFSHPKYGFLRASLDGINADHSKLVEIKCPGLAKWRMATKGTVLDYYYTQVQQQMACSGAKECEYWVYREKEGGVLIEIPRNEEYIEEIYRRGNIFWDCVLNEEPALPRAFGIDMSKGISDPFTAGNMECKLIQVYKN